MRIPRARVKRTDMSEMIPVGKVKIPSGKVIIPGGRVRIHGCEFADTRWECEDTKCKGEYRWGGEDIR